MCRSCRCCKDWMDLHLWVFEMWNSSTSPPPELWLFMKHKHFPMKTALCAQMIAFSCHIFFPLVCYSLLISPVKTNIHLMDFCGQFVTYLWADMIDIGHVETYSTLFVSLCGIKFANGKCLFLVGSRSACICFKHTNMNNSCPKIPCKSTSFLGFLTFSCTTSLPADDSLQFLCVCFAAEMGGCNRAWVAVRHIVVQKPSMRQ